MIIVGDDCNILVGDDCNMCYNIQLQWYCNELICTLVKTVNLINTTWSRQKDVLVLTNTNSTDLLLISLL